MTGKVYRCATKYMTTLNISFKFMNNNTTNYSFNFKKQVFINFVPQ
jgi:hypothetical protein